MTRIRSFMLFMMIVTMTCTACITASRASQHLLTIQKTYHHQLACTLPEVQEPNCGKHP